MKVSELIERLSSFDGNLDVCIYNMVEKDFPPVRIENIIYKESEEIVTENGYEILPILILD